MKTLSHESLTVYQRSIEFVAWASQLCETNDDLIGEIQSQFKRAFISIPLNIAEGAGKQSVRDQARFYDIARGSSWECAACLDVVVAMKIVSRECVARGKSLLLEIACMLSALAKSVAGDRIKEEYAILSW